MTSSTPLPPPPGSSSGRNLTQATAKGEAATRRASMLLYILGALVLLVAAFSFLTLTLDPQVLIDQLLASAPPSFREQLKQENLHLVVRVQWIIAGTIATFMGLSLILSAAPLRRGRRGVVVYAIVIVILCTLWCGLNVLVGVVAGLLGNLQAIPGVLLASCVLAAFVACLMALVGSYKAASFAIQRHRIALQSLRYPPGYASGYGAQVSTAIPIIAARPDVVTPRPL